VTTSLLTDHYELTMVRAAIHSGVHNRHSVFEMFARHLPEGRRYGIVAGAGRLLDALDEFRFSDEDIEFLRRAGIADDALSEWLADYRFTGSIWGYPDGEAYFPNSPILIVEGGFAETVVVETLALSIYNYDCAVASAASRMALMAGTRPCIEMGSRRTNEWSAVGAARAAYIAGFASTSNLQAGARYGVPTAGTAAHSFVLLYDTERDAFSAQLATLGDDTTLLIDTYDVEQAVRTGVELTQGRLGAVRIDSGDLAELAVSVRRLLDSLGATETRIIVTSDLDEYQIASLRGAPVDGFGVGTSLVTGSGAPTCAFVYKLVARAASDDPRAPLEPVAKLSTGKASVGGRKYAVRRLDAKGRATAEVIGVGVPPAGDTNDRPLLVQLVDHGAAVGREPLSEARARHNRTIAELPLVARKMSRGEPAIETVFQ